MNARDVVAMLFIVAGLSLGMLAWSLRELWWGVTGALLFAGGFWLIYTRGREHRITIAMANAHQETPPAWRLGRRRSDGEDDLGGDEGSIDGD